MQVITIANRDDLCRDCKLTVEYKVEEIPSWWRRIFLGERPVTRIKIDVWYGHDTTWNSSPSRSIGISEGRAKYLSNIWKYHVNEKNRRGIKGPYKTIIDSQTGVTNSFKEGEAKIVQFNDYKALHSDK